MPSFCALPSFEPASSPATHVVRLLGHRVAHHAAEILDALLDLPARVVLESTRDHDGQSGEWAADAGRLLDHVHASRDQLVDYAQVVGIAEPGVDAFGDLRADAFDRQNVLEARLAQLRPSTRTRAPAAPRSDSRRSGCRARTARWSGCAACCARCCRARSGRSCRPCARARPAAPRVSEYRSPGSYTRPLSISVQASLAPTVSMSIEPRPTKCASSSKRCATHFAKPPVQRAIASPSGRITSEPHTGHCCRQLRTAWRSSAAC